MVEMSEVGGLMILVGLLGVLEEAKMVGAAEIAWVRTSITAANIAGMTEHFILRVEICVRWERSSPELFSTIPSRVLHSKEGSSLNGDATKWEWQLRT